MINLDDVTADTNLNEHYGDMTYHEAQAAWEKQQELRKKASESEYVKTSTAGLVVLVLICILIMMAVNIWATGRAVTRNYDTMYHLFETTQERFESYKTFHNQMGHTFDPDDLQSIFKNRIECESEPECVADMEYHKMGENDLTREIQRQIDLNVEKRIKHDDIMKWIPLQGMRDPIHREGGMKDGL